MSDMSFPNSGRLVSTTIRKKVTLQFCVYAQDQITAEGKKSLVSNAKNLERYLVRDICHINGKTLLIRVAMICL